MHERNRNILLISSQLYEFMDDEYPLTDERIRKLEIRLQQLMQEEFTKGYIYGRKELLESLEDKGICHVIN